MFVLQRVLYIVLSLLLSLSLALGQPPDDIKKLQLQLDTLPEDTVRVRVLNELAARMMRTETQTALDYSYEGLDLSRKINDPIGEANHLRTLSNILLLTDDYDSALRYQNEALRIFEALDIPLEIGICYNNLAGIYQAQSYYSKALDHLIKSSEILEAHGQYRLCAIVDYNIGSLYVELKEYDKAIKWAQKSLNYYLENKNDTGLCDSYSLIGEIEVLNGELQKAEVSFNKSLPFCEAAKDIYSITDVYNQFGLIYLRQNKIDMAEQSFKKALETLSQIIDPSKTVESQLGLAEVALRRQKTEEAQGILDQALVVSQSINKHDLLRDIHRLSVKVDSIQGDFLSAYQHHKMQMAYQDSIFNAEQSRQLAELEAAYESNRKDQEIDLLTKNSEIETLKSQRLKTTRNAFLIGLVLILVILGLVIFGYKSKQRALNIIDDQKSVLEVTNIEKDALISEKDMLLQERDMLIQEVHHRVKNNLQIVLSILSSQKRRIKNHHLLHILDDTESRIRSMSLIHRNLYQTNNFILINTQKYFSDLIDNLRTSYPDTRGKIRIERNLEEHQISIKLAIPLGLIMNELLTNAYKHAFSDRTDGIISASFQQLKDGKYSLGVKDNGKGMPPDIAVKGATTLGLELVNGLATQLGAHLKFKTGENGSSFCITFDLDDVEYPQNIDAVLN
ncbi:MAG: tetratricopeptide repeat protein [Bacteroidota bacterium]